MEHVIFYPAADGVASFHRVASLDEAVSFVEQLRNAENITEFSVHSMTPVPLSLRAYYHVEVPSLVDVGVPSLVDVGVPSLVDVEVPSLVETSPVAHVESPEPIDAGAPDAVAADAAADSAENNAEQADAASAPEIADLADDGAPAADEDPAAHEVLDTPVGEFGDTAADESGEVAESAGTTAATGDVELAAASDEVLADGAESDGTPGRDEVTMVPIQATDEDRSAAWVAEAAVIESSRPDVVVPGLAPQVEPVAGPPAFPPALPDTPFADAPPVTAPTSDRDHETVRATDAADAIDTAAADETAEADVVPVPTGRRSMGFFAR